MKFLILGVHLLREDVEPEATALPAGDLHLSAVGIAAGRSAGDRDLILQAAAVRGRLLERATFLAVRYGFVAASAEEAARRCAGRLEAWKELLEKWRGHVEMTLKIAAADPRPRPRREEFQDGAAYLRALHEAARAADPAPGFRASAERLLGVLADRARWIHRDERSLEYALLVPRSSVERSRQACEELRSVAPSVPFLFSGPWPLETFADDDHE